MKTLALELGGERFEEALEGSGVPLGQLATPGRVLELSGVGAAARHSTAAALVRQAQQEGETTVWVQLAGGPLYPPDLSQPPVDFVQLAGSLGVPAVQVTSAESLAEALRRSFVARGPQVIEAVLGE